MGLKGLAEGIIFQSIEDLWNEGHREDCISFFRGEDFRLCAELAGMGLEEQMKLLDMVKGVVEHHSKERSFRKVSRPLGSTRRKWSVKELAPCR